METSHRITVLGRELRVRSAAPPDRVREIESFVNSKLAEVAAVAVHKDTQSVVILALLNIAEAYLDVIRENADKLEKEAAMIASLVQRIRDGLS